jgi:hypothetical protein
VVGQVTGSDDGCEPTKPTQDSQQVKREEKGFLGHALRLSGEVIKQQAGRIGITRDILGNPKPTNDVLGSWETLDTTRVRL